MRPRTGYTESAVKNIAGEVASKNNPNSNARSDGLLGMELIGEGHQPICKAGNSCITILGYNRKNLSSKKLYWLSNYQPEGITINSCYETPKIGLFPSLLVTLKPKSVDKTGLTSC